MTPTLLELVVTVMLLWVAWQLGLKLTPYVIAYFRRILRPARPEPTAADRAAAAFQAVSSHPPHADQR